MLPERDSGKRRGAVFFGLPPKIQLLHCEVIRAFDADALVRCTAGLRALIEAILTDKRLRDTEPQPKNLEAAIDALAKMLPANVVRTLHTFRFMGNAALHDVVRPDRVELHRALNVIEDILNFYEIHWHVRILERKG